MWVFGHLGIGSRLAKPFSRGLPARYLLLGTLLPDLVDKPLYFLSAMITGRTGADIGLISCTRTVGHSGIFVAVILGYAFLRKSRVSAALSLGMATHLLLDGLQDAVGIYFLGQPPPSSMLLAVLYPFYSAHFANYPFSGIGEHASSFGSPLVWIAEIFGLIIFYRDFWRPHLLKIRSRN